jgi:hypothetical protein
MKRILRFGAAIVGFLALFVLGFAWPDIQRGAPMPASAVRALVGLPVGAQSFSAKQLYGQTFKRISKDY